MTTKSFINQSRWLATIVLLLTLSTGQLLADLTIDFEADYLSDYTDWSFSNIEFSEAITAHGGDWYGCNYDGASGTETASITTVNKIAAPSTLSCYVSKESKNTTSSTWYIEVSSNGSAWTEVETQSATSMSKGTWVEFSADLSEYTNVYVRIRYSGSSAYRCIDDIVLEEGETCSTELTLTHGTPAPSNGSFKLTHPFLPRSPCVEPSETHSAKHVSMSY